MKWNDTAAVEAMLWRGSGMHWGFFFLGIMHVITQHYHHVCSEEGQICALFVPANKRNIKYLEQLGAGSLSDSAGARA